MTTAADYKMPIRKSFYVLIAYAIFGNSPVSANTIVAIKFSDTAAVIATDSRVSGPDGQAREYEVCKITVLDDSHIFVSAGLSSVQIHAVPLWPLGVSLFPLPPPASPLKAKADGAISAQLGAASAALFFLAVEGENSFAGPGLLTLGANLRILSRSFDGTDSVLQG